MMRKYGCLLLAIFPLVSYSQGSTISEGYEWLANRCKDLECVQENINMIDSAIATLVAKRLAYVKRGAELKNSNVLAPKTPGYGDTQGRASETAKALGTSSGSVGSVFKALQQQSNEYEKQYLKSAPKSGAAPASGATSGAGSNQEPGSTSGEGAAQESGTTPATGSEP